jgi:hypothetical protein
MAPKIDVVFLCTKITIIKLPLTIIRILVGFGYIESVEPQGLRKCCFQAFFETKYNLI